MNNPCKALWRRIRAGRRESIYVVEECPEASGRVWDTGPILSASSRYEPLTKEAFDAIMGRAAE